MLIEIPGEPQSDARPRAARIGGFIKFYDCKAKEKQIVKKFLMCEIATQLKDFPIEVHSITFGTSFSIKFEFYMPIPQSWSEKKRQNAHLQKIPHTVKPDIDNLSKFYLDCMNKIIYHDDSQITNLLAQKSYSLVPKTVILILSNGGKINGKS